MFFLIVHLSFLYAIKVMVLYISLLLPPLGIFHFYSTLSAFNEQYFHNNAFIYLFFWFTGLSVSEYASVVSLEGVIQDIPSQAIEHDVLWSISVPIRVRRVETVIECERFRLFSERETLKKKPYLCIQLTVENKRWISFIPLYVCTKALKWWVTHRENIKVNVWESIRL